MVSLEDLLQQALRIHDLYDELNGSGRANRCPNPPVRAASSSAHPSTGSTLTSISMTGQRSAPIAVTRPEVVPDSVRKIYPCQIAARPG